jgi:hypothetical protein
MYSWKLWLDDQAFDVDVPNRHAPKGFVAAISTAQAKNLVENFGAPYMMDLDHDLGGGDDAVEFLKWMMWNDVDYKQLGDGMRGPIEFSIHSENPIGVMRIKSFMDSWEKAWNEK